MVRADFLKTARSQNLDYNNVARNVLLSSLF